MQNIYNIRFFYSHASGIIWQEPFIGACEDENEKAGNGHAACPLAGKLLRFTLPVALSSIVQQLFNAADTAVVGSFGSADALAAVGTNTEIVALVVTVSAGLSIGANVLLSGQIGRGET